MENRAVARTLAGAFLLLAGSHPGHAGSASEAAPDGSAGDGPAALPGAFGEAVRLGDKGLTFQPPGDDAVSLRIAGRLHIDYGSTAKPRDPDPIFRRSWLEAYLLIRGGIEVAFQYDFANATAPIFDAVVAYSGVAPVMVSIGNMREPTSIDRLTNTNTTLFTETALPIAFTPVRSFGGAVGVNGARWTGVFGVFGQNANMGITGDGVAGVGRVTYAPILSETEVLHLGVSASYRALDPQGVALSFSSVPETFVYSRTESLVDTGPIAGAAAVRVLAGEGAYRIGPVKIQAEYIHTAVDRKDGASSLSFDGGYAQAEWVINGDPRAYELKPAFGTTYATFSGIKVKDSQRVVNGGIGVFELGARLSRIDLQDKQIRGGVETDVTAGLNWYPNDNMRYMFDYIHAETAHVALDRPRSRDIFVGRLQVYW